jgi:hypothetical protein
LTLYLCGIRWHAFVYSYVRIFLGTSSPEAVMAEPGGNGNVFRPRLFHGNGRAMFRLIYIHDHEVKYPWFHLDSQLTEAHCIIFKVRKRVDKHAFITEHLRLLRSKER